MHRRTFLKYSSLATGSTLVPGFLSALNLSTMHAGFEGKRLVVIQLSGGCDGLSAAVPYRNDIYQSARKRTVIETGSVLKLDDEMGFNPNMKGMYSLFNDGLMTLFNNVGYPNANRSHFRSMDIWHTGSDAGQYWNTGWIGRYLDNVCQGLSDAHKGLEIDDTLSLSMKGEKFNGMAVRDVDMLYRSLQTGRLRALAKTESIEKSNSDIDFLYKTLTSTANSIDYLKANYKIYRSRAAFPTTEFGKQLRSISELICSGVNSSVYYASLSGFDTHASQKGSLDQLLAQVSDGVTALTNDLKANDRLNDSLILIFSEFGRRVAENASGGTDHGAGNNLYLIGGGLKKPGIFNGPTDLSQLDSGDVRYKMDFRQIYSEILSKWLGADDTKILNHTYIKPGFIT